MKFNYTGTTRDGRGTKGTVEAADEGEARLRLRSMQVRPQKVTAISSGSMFGGKQKESPSPAPKDQKEGFDFSSIAIGPPVDLKGMIVFTRQFSSLIDSGIAIVQCLDILGSQEKRPPFKKILRKVKEDIESGSGLAEALARHPKAFNDLFVRIVEAGEISGTLDVALRRVGQQMEKLGKIKSKVIGALLYPMITVVVSMIVLVFLLVKVIPEVAKLYTQSNAKLPEITQFVLDLSQKVQDNYVYIIGGTIGFFVGISALYKLPGFRKVWDPIVLKVPIFGDLLTKSAVARLTRTLSMLLQSGVPLLNAFDICARLMSNLAIRNTIVNAATGVTEGKGIATGLAEGNMFPPMVIHMISIGEMTGRLDELLGKVADIYDDEVDDAIGIVTGMIQPALIVVVGALIAGLLLAMYLPIFSLAEKATM